MLSEQNNFADAQSFSDPSEQVRPKDQRTAAPTKPTKQQLLEAEIDQAFHEVFESDQQNPTEENPHAAVFDEMADDLYQTMLQEQAKEEAAAGLTPIPNQAKAPDDSTQGWTNNGNIQYNMQEEISAAPIAQQAYLRQFWDETKQRFSAVKLLFDTQPYGSFQPAFAVADGKGLPDYSNDNTVSPIGIYADKQVATQEQNNTKHSEKSESINHSSRENSPDPKLPNQGIIKGNVSNAPSIDAGKQGKHVQGHPNCIKGKSMWLPENNGVQDTQEAWINGTTLPDGTRVWDTGKTVGINGETGVRVHIDGRGNIHGYPVNPGRYLQNQ